MGDGSLMTAAHALVRSEVVRDGCANDDASALPDRIATITVHREPQWPGTDPVACVEVRDARGHLIEVFDGSDGLRMLGEAIELCRERGLEVSSIREVEPAPAPTHNERARQREAAIEAWRAWSSTSE
jgi:hypothetical protein